MWKDDLGEMPGDGVVVKVDIEAVDGEGGARCIPSTRCDYPNLSLQTLYTWFSGERLSDVCARLPEDARLAQSALRCERTWVLILTTDVVTNVRLLRLIDRKASEV